MIDDDFLKSSVSSQLDNISKIVEKADWRKVTHQHIADNLVQSVEELLDGKAHYYVCCDKKTFHRKIVIEYDHQTK